MQAKLLGCINSGDGKIETEVQSSGQGVFYLDCVLFVLLRLPLDIYSSVHKPFLDASLYSAVRPSERLAKSKGTKQ